MTAVLTHADAWVRDVGSLCSSARIDVLTRNRDALNRYLANVEAAAP